MEMLQTILSRRSGRSYTGEPVPEAALEAILTAGCLAPSGRNKKSAEFIVIRGRQAMDALADVRAMGSAMLKTADCAIVVVGRSVLSDTWVEDGSIAMTQMMLRATELGIANCWIQCRNRAAREPGKTSEDYLRGLLNIPEDCSALAILSLGMPDQQLPPHSAAELDPAKIHRNSF